MKASTLKSIQEKNPKFTVEQIKFIINRHLGNINNKLVMNETMSLVVPKFGRIHTHGRAINKQHIKRKRAYIRKAKKYYDFTDKALLF